MRLVYIVSCAISLVLCSCLGWSTRPRPDGTNAEENPEGFRRFQVTFLLAWAICVAADWLQGPYVYALYEQYGYPRDVIAQLFVAGFGASFFFGTIVAGVADTLGRKKTTLLYCLLYSVSCFTKHVNDYYILMLGRITGGIATSILFSVFESWLVYAHRTKFPPRLLSYNFSLMYFINYLVAVATGLTAEVVVDAVRMTKVSGNFYAGGVLMPFDMSILSLLIGGLYIMCNWTENYGDRAESATEVLGNFGKAVSIVCTDLPTALCCTIVALFEASMYIFVFNWTPVLSQGEETPPHGVIFATMMMCCMIGASVFALCRPLECNNKVLMFATSLAAASTVLPAFGGISEALTDANFFAFLVLECCSGIYFPAVASLKSDVVGESCRSTVYNIFRAPMNCITVIVLLLSPSLSNTFQIVFQMLLVATLAVAFLVFGPVREIQKTEALMRPKTEARPV